MKKASFNIVLRFPLELIVSIMILLIILRESLLQESYGSTIFNVGILIGATMLVIFTKLSNKFSIIIFPLFITMALSVIFNSTDIDKGGYITFGLTILSFLLLFINIKKVNVKKLYYYIVCITMAFIFVVYYYYLMGLQVIPAHIFYVLAGPFQNQNQTGMILLSLSTLIVNLQKNRLNHIMLLLLACSVILTQSRSAMLGLVILLSFYYRKKLFFLLPVLVVLIMKVVLIYADVFERLLYKFKNGSTSHRMEFWTNALTGLQNSIGSLLFGQGVNVTTVELDGVVLSLHNSYINFVVAYGLIPSIFIGILILYILYIAKRENNLVFVTLLSFLAQGFFETSLLAGFSICWLSFILVFVFRRSYKFT